MKQKRRKLKKKVKIILLCSILFIALLSLALILTFTGHNDKEEGYGNISNVNISPEDEGIGELTFMLIDVGQAQSIFIDRRFAKCRCCLILALM